MSSGRRRNRSLGSGASKKHSPIRFYERGEPYFEFTNFAEFPIQLDGKTWPTSEHYFQAQKFIGTPYVEQVRNLPRARDAFELSRRPEVSQWLRSDWEGVKQDVMYKALLAKFSQHVKLRDLLVETGDRQLIEHTSRDSYWGDGGDGRGQNHLGQLLMKVRAELFTASNDLKTSSVVKESSAVKQIERFPDIRAKSMKPPANNHTMNCPLIVCNNDATSTYHIPATLAFRNASDHHSGKVEGRLNFGDHNLRVAIALLCCFVLLLIYWFLLSWPEQVKTDSSDRL